MNIVSRAAWGAVPPIRTHQIALPTPELWLHHSAGAGADEPTIRRIQNFHMAPPPFGRGWSDIAYSFLVDDDPPDVDIFEGRGVGIAGGHTKGRNTVSHAICVIGNFTDRPPHDDTIEAVIALAVHGHRQGWWRAGFSGGHRDAPNAATACPGDALHALIPMMNAEIRRRLEDDMPDPRFSDENAALLNGIADEIRRLGSNASGFVRELLLWYRANRDRFRDN